MKVVGLCGYSNAGKTRLAEQLIGELKAAGARVSAVKHAHAGFDIDHPGKDSQRMRGAGAFEVVVGSGQRIAKVREFELPFEINVHHLLNEVADPGDRPLWVLVEGFRHMDRLKLEFWEPCADGVPVRQPLYVEDPFVVAIITDHPEALPEPTLLPLFRRGDAPAIAAFLLGNAHRFDYISPFDPGPDVEPPPFVRHGSRGEPGSSE
jgi:molybdopterin-guanine dinucleotide biosynthesis adapter protein